MSPELWDSSWPGVDQALGDPWPHGSTEALEGFGVVLGRFEALRLCNRRCCILATVLDAGDAPRLCGAQWWLLCWRRHLQGYQWFMAALATQRGKSRGPRRVGEPQAQPRPSQMTLHCRGVWGGFDEGSPHGETAQPFSLWVLGTPGHNRQRCWGQMAPGTGQMAPSQTGSRGAGGPGACGAGRVPGDSFCRPPAGGCGPRGTVTPPTVAHVAPPAVGGADTAGPVGTGLEGGRTRARGRDARPGRAAPAGGGGTGPRRATPVRGKG